MSGEYRCELGKQYADLSLDAEQERVVGLPGGVFVEQEEQQRGVLVGHMKVVGEQQREAEAEAADGPHDDVDL